MTARSSDRQWGRTLLLVLENVDKLSRGLNAKDAGYPFISVVMGGCASAARLIRQSCDDISMLKIELCKGSVESFSVEGYSLTV